MLREIPGTDICISGVSLGCWPMAGISSLEVNDEASEATVEAALDAGINHFDTAYSYGYEGRSDRVLQRVLGYQWDKVVLSSKVGSHYKPDRTRVLDSSRSRLQFEFDELRKRLQRDTIDLLYLHAPDGVTPVEEVAELFSEWQLKGWIRYACLSNASPEETRRFASVLRPALLQPSFNMLQQESLIELRPILRELGCGAATYWSLMKGLFAGKMARHHSFAPEDRRLTYPMYQGEEWERNQDFIDQLRGIAAELQWTVARLVVHWTMHQEGVTTVLCGAKRPEQIRETAEAMRGELTSEARLALERAIAQRLDQTAT